MGWVTNTSNGVRTIGGHLLLPGESVFVDEPAGSFPTPPTPGVLSSAQKAALLGLVNPNKNKLALDSPGGPSLYSVFALSNNALTAYYKREAEAPFLSATIVIRSNGNNPIFTPVPSEIGFAIAVTETGDDSVDANKFTPRINGVSTNALWSPTNPYGWQVGSFAGRPVTSGTETGNDGAQVPWVVYQVRSAKLPVRSIDRADIIGARPLYLLRIFKTASANQLSASSEDNTAAGADPMTAGPKAYSRIRKAWLTAGDGVTTLSIVPTSAPNNVYTYDVSVEFEYQVPVRSFWMAGDSTDENFGANGWFNRAIKSLSRTHAPIVGNMLGWSSRPSKDFCMLVEYYLRSGAALPTDFMIPVVSPNDSPPTIAKADERHARYLALFTLIRLACQQAGMDPPRIYLFGAFPNNTYNGGLDQGEDARLYSQAWGRARAADATVTKYIEAGDVLGTGAYPNRFLPDVTYDNSLHPNLGGVELVTPGVAQGVAL